MVIAVLYSCSYSYTMQVEETKAPIFGTYLGESLTPKSLPLLAPPLAQEAIKPIRAWLNVPLHKWIIESLMTLKWPLAGISGNFLTQAVGINKLLQFNKMPNISFDPDKKRFGWNYIFDIEGTNYVMQIAGPLYRAKCLLVFNDPNPNDPHLQETTDDIMCDQVIVKQSATYQTVSRVAHYLRAIEAIEKFGLNSVIVPKTYLIGKDKDEHNEVNDNNSIVIQEKLKKTVIPVRENVDKLVSGISPKMVEEFLILVVYADLWDLEANLLFDIQSGKFVISDLEQPGGSNPSEFFQKNMTHVLRQIRSGINQINRLFSKFPHLHDVCQKFVDMSDQELKEIGSGKKP